MLKMFGCPMHYGVGAKGLINSLNYIQDQYGYHFPIIEEITMEEEGLDHLKNLNSVIATCDAIANYSYNEILSKGDIPLYVGGDHSASMGSVSAASAYYGETGLIWVDAHTDINTDATTDTGNIHGMPVAALLGMGDKRLTQFLNDHPKIKAENIVYIGLRSVDAPEQVFIDDMHIKYYTYEDVKNKGLDHCLEESVAYLKHLKHVHLSFDIDAVNPSLLPGVSVPVKDGFTIEEVYQVIGTYLDQLSIGSIDVVEYNHDKDQEEKTAHFLLEMLCFISRHMK